MVAYPGWRPNLILVLNPAPLRFRSRCEGVVAAVKTRLLPTIPCQAGQLITIQWLLQRRATREPFRVKLVYLSFCTMMAACASNQTTATAGGWLLLVPQINQAGYAATELPLSKWQTVGNFTSQIDCTSSMQNQQSFAMGQAGPITNAQNYNQDQALQILNGKCVSADEPGLRAK